MSKNLNILNVVDLEATCWKEDPPPGQNNEIIEIGICVVDLSNLKILKNGTMLVIPKTSTVSEFCTSLTTITPEMLEADGISFQEACAKLREEYDSKKYTWTSWGDYDRRQLERQCKREGVKYPFGITHLNLKNLFAVQLGFPRELGMGAALKHLQLEIEGTHHRAIDDARNIANIACEIFYAARQFSV